MLLRAPLAPGEVQESLFGGKYCTSFSLILFLWVIVCLLVNFDLDVGFISAAPSDAALISDPGLGPVGVHVY